MKKRRWRVWIWRVGRLALMAYLVVLLGCSMFQESLIFPGHASQGQPFANIRPVPDSELIYLTTSLGDRVAGLFGKPMDADGNALPDSATRPTIIFFYGNAMTLSDCIGFCRTWRKLGANVLGVEYPGYGLSSGRPSEPALYAAADAAWDYLVNRPDIDKTKIIPAGLSLGSGVATDLASRKPVAALALFAPYTSMADMGKALMPWIPASMILRHHFKNEEKIKNLTIPILIVHGDHDHMIPPSMSRQLADAATHAKVKLLYVDSDHNDLFEAGRGPLDAAMAELIDQVNRGK
jgi:fermentation-respiration switch protein FrsA (DUF1100 family)